MAIVLVADDDAANRLLVATVLGHAGHTVIEAANGTDALALASSTQPDLVLLDLSMPEMTGPQFLRELRANAATHDIAVALYTATDPSAALHDFMEAYAIRGLVPKPSEPSELVAAVARFLEQKGST